MEYSDNTSTSEDSSALQIDLGRWEEMDPADTQQTNDSNEGIKEDVELKQKNIDEFHEHEIKTKRFCGTKEKKIEYSDNTSTSEDSSALHIDLGRWEEMDPADTQQTSDSNEGIKEDVELKQKNIDEFHEHEIKTKRFCGTKEKKIEYSDNTSTSEDSSALHIDLGRWEEMDPADTQQTSDSNEGIKEDVELKQKNIDEFHEYEIKTKQFCGTKEKKIEYSDNTSTSEDSSALHIDLGRWEEMDPADTQETSDSNEGIKDDVELKQKNIDEFHEYEIKTKQFYGTKEKKMEYSDSRPSTSKDWSSDEEQLEILYNETVFAEYQEAKSKHVPETKMDYLHSRPSTSKDWSGDELEENNSDGEGTSNFEVKSQNSSKHAAEKMDYLYSRPSTSRDWSGDELEENNSDGEGTSNFEVKSQNSSKHAAEKRDYSNSRPSTSRDWSSDEEIETKRVRYNEEPVEERDTSRTVVDKKIYKCSICNIKFKCREGLQKHFGFHVKEQRHFCPICRKYFRIHEDLKRHMQIHRFTCAICDMSFKFMWAFRQHIKIHRGRRFTDFRNKMNLLKHKKKIHGVDRPHMCKMCDRVFKLKHELIKHLKHHRDEKRYICVICGKAFKRKSALRVHCRIHTGKKPYKCEICKRKFKSKANLIEHIKIHSGKKPYKCKICGQYFTRNSNLIRHSRIHTGEKPYECGICGKRFKSKSELQGHIKIHTDEKPHTCNICEKSFITKHKLNRHLRTHTGVKPYPCKVCTKSFHDNNQLEIHSRTHTGERPFKCDVCGKCYISRGGLSKHKKTHSDRPPMCPICKRFYTLKANLLRHIRRVHSEDEIKKMKEKNEEEERKEKNEKEEKKEKKEKKR